MFKERRELKNKSKQVKTRARVFEIQSKLSVVVKRHNMHILHLRMCTLSIHIYVYIIYMFALDSRGIVDCVVSLTSNSNQLKRLKPGSRHSSQ